MNPIAVFWHTRLSGGWQPDSAARRFDAEWGRGLFDSQLRCLKQSCLGYVANSVFIGLNGNSEEADLIDEKIGPGCGVRILEWGQDAHSELPTLNFLHQWAQKAAHAKFHCLYIQAKGYTHPNDPLCDAWRNCMMHHLVQRWETCMEDLDAGFDSVGCHWIETPAGGFWGGNFFWAKAAYLATLPAPLPVPTNEAEFRARYSHSEGWFCSGKIRPKIKDYHHSWPDERACKQSIK